MIHQIIKSDDFLAFNDEVENEFKDEYWQKIPYPTCLTQIKTRLETDYYRSKEAVLWETDLIHRNCIEFNGHNDEDSNGTAQESNSSSNNGSSTGGSASQLVDKGEDSNVNSSDVTAQDSIGSSNNVSRFIMC